MAVKIPLSKQLNLKKMKKKILTLTALVMVTGFTAFSQEDKKAKEARKDVAEAKQDLKEARIDSAADFQKFKKDAETIIAENKTKISDLKIKKIDGSKEDKQKYDKKIAALEKRNNELRKKIETCDSTKTSMWTSFKQEFNHDMNELGLAIKDIGVDNKK